MLLNSHISAYATCIAGKVCGPVRSTWGTSLGEDKLGAKARIVHTKVARLSFCPITFLPISACRDDKLLGDIISCTNCNHKVHALCTQHGHCFKCVCRVCNQPPGSDMRACNTCKHLVHTTCAVHVAPRVEVVCKACTPRPRVHPPTAKNEKRCFKPEWQVGCPWLQHANGVMWSVACREYPQPGVQQCWLASNTQLRRRIVEQHGNSGLHCKSLALWKSGGT